MKRFLHEIRPERIRIAVSKKIRANPSIETNEENTSDVLLNVTRDLNQKKLKRERDLISQALAKVGGRLTRAASSSGMSYQFQSALIAKVCLTHRFAPVVPGKQLQSALIAKVCLT